MRGDLIYPLTSILSARTIYFAAIDPIRPIPGKPTIIVDIFRSSLQIQTVLLALSKSMTDNYYSPFKDHYYSRFITNTYVNYN